MINNRQNGRRRGRGGGPRTPNMMGGSGGNRQDNRSRGNASQLHEKYKTLARDAQMAGDRVQTEYYLQFADHYYRVLNEMRSRYEEQRPVRGDQRDDYDDDEDQQDDVQTSDGRDEEDRRPQRRERFARQDEREDRGEARESRNGQPRGDQGRGEQARNDEGREPREARPRRARNPRRDEGERADEGQRGEEGERIAFDVLPPSIGIVADEDGEAPKPRRRTRRKPGDGDEIAPAA